MSVIKFFGSMLMAIGGLIMTLCGACTGIAFLAALASGLTQLASGHPGDLGKIFVPVVFGGIPFIIGWVIYAAGKAIAGGGDSKGLPDARARPTVNLAPGPLAAVKSAMPDVTKKALPALKEFWAELVRTDVFLIREMKKIKVPAYSLILFGGVIERVGGGIALFIAVVAMAHDLRTNGEHQWIFEALPYFLFYGILPWALGTQLVRWGQKQQSSGPTGKPDSAQPEGLRPPPSEPKSFYGALLMVAGSLSMLGAVWIVGHGINAGLRWRHFDFLEFFILPVIMAVIPFALGAGLFFLGRYLIRQAEKPK